MGTAVARAALLALGSVAALAWLGLTGFAWTDYDLLAAGPVAAMVAGDWGGFLQMPSAGGPSLLLRAPFALAADALGGGELAVYRALALPCLVATAVVAVVVAAPRLRVRDGAASWAWLVVLLIAANPLSMRALDTGHPEELLAASLAVAAVLAALGQRAAWAAVLLGLCIATKLWGLLVIGPVLLALGRHRLAVLAGAGAIGAAFVLPFVLSTAPAAGGGLAGGIGRTSTEMQPWQVWWFFGGTGDVVRGFDGLVKADFRTLPDGLVAVTRPLVIGCAAALAVLWSRRRRGDLLALLALVMLVRCVLDPYDNAYYHLPMLFALVASETRARTGPPLVSVAVTLLLLAVLRWVPAWAPPDLQAAAYLLVALPLAGWLATVAFGVQVRLPFALARRTRAVA